MGRQNRRRCGSLRLLSVMLLVPWASSGAAQELPMPRPVPAASPAALSLDDLLRISLEQNPDLRQAGFDVEIAQGRAVQAGLYPNPTVTAILDELGDRTGPGGINTLPLVTQEIVTGGKLGLSRSVALREVDQATLALLRQRYTLFAAVRQGYFEVLVAQRRVEVLAELRERAEELKRRFDALRKAGTITEPDVALFVIPSERLLAERQTAQQELGAAWYRLTAAVGVPSLPHAPLERFPETALPRYEFHRARAYLLEVHPDVRSAQVGVTRAQLALRRAQVEPIPNVTVGAGYVRQNQNKSDDWVFQVGAPLPVWNRNQGNIRAAQAELGHALQEVSRVQNELTNRLATAMGQYAAAERRVRRYASLLTTSRTSFDAIFERYKKAPEEKEPLHGQMLYVLQFLQNLIDVNEEYLRALNEAWRAASELSGLLLEEQWPLSLAGTCLPQQREDSGGPNR